MAATRIREKWAELVEGMRPVGPYCDLMLARGTMSRETLERITSDGTSYDQARKFLSYLLSQDDAAIQAFIKRLEELQPHLASCITQADAGDGHVQTNHKGNPAEDRASNHSDTSLIVDGGSSMANLAEQFGSNGEDSNASTKKQVESDQPEFLDQPGNSTKQSRVRKRLKESVKDISINQETPLMKKTREETKVKLQDCQRILIELKRDSTDLGGNELKERKTKLCQMLDISKAKWIDEQKPMETRVDNLLTDITHVLRATKENPPILQTFASASGGLALKGILRRVVGSNAESKETALNAPRTVKVTKPSMQCDCLVREFTSEADCERFLKTLDLLGRSVAAGPIVTTSPSQPQSKNNEGDVSKDCNFYSRVVCCFHATAACPVDSNDLRFSPEVLSELEKIGKAIKEQSKHGIGAERIEEACMGFLRTFGSHVNTGLLHLGGMKRFIGTYSGRAQPRDQVRSLIEHALNGYIMMSSSGLLCSDTVKVSAADLKTALHIPLPYDGSNLSHISLETSNNGGLDVANLPVWKMGLSVNRNSWALIDRCSLLEHTTLWDLIPNHKDFDGPMQVASCLQTSWEKAISVQRPVAIAPLLCELESSLDSWSSDPMFLGNCQERLLRLLFVIEELFRETQSYGYWEHVLSPQKAFRQFLAKVETEEQFPAECERFIRYTMGRIRRAGCQTGLQSELDHELKNVPITMRTITDVPTLVTALKDKLIPFFKSTAQRKPEHFRGIEACIAIELAVAISHLLQSTSSPLEIWLLRISLSQVQYHPKQMRFEHGITLEKLDKFYSVVEGNWKRFDAVEGTSLKESFVKNLQKESEFNRMIKDARQGFSQQEPDLLEKQGTSPVQWSDDRMIGITDQTAPGNAKDQREFGIVNTLNPGPFRDLLWQLGLHLYYPNGITWQEATEIKTFPPKLEKIDIPWKLLNGLLMMDYHARDQVSSELKTQLEDNDHLSEFDIEDLFGQICCARSDETQLNPVDVFLVTFLCCDGNLRQQIARNLFVCKLAIPFFYLDGFSQPSVSLWALRTIVLEWYDRQQKGQEASATQHNLHTISFVRIGRPSASKSRIANYLVRNDSHPTFHCSERECGTGRKVVADGMVECSWFLPANNEKDLHEDPCLLLNLRGDAVVWKQQVKVLKDISAVLAVVINIEDLKGEEQQTLAQLCQAVRGAVILLTTESNKPDEKMAKANLGSFMEEIGKEYQNKIRYTSLLRGLGALQKLKFCKHLSELLQGSSSLCLEEISCVAAEQNFWIDEEDPVCIEGEELAREVAALIEEKDLKYDKKELLPLQCDTWLKYSHLERKLHQKPTPSVREHQKDMIRLRQNQADMCNNLSPVCQKFAQCLVNSREDEVNKFFLDWFRILLDRRTKSILPRLKSLYLAKWKEVQEAKESSIKDEKRIQSLNADLSKALEDLDNAHLELNHFFREIGQIYEATESVALKDVRGDPLLSEVKKAPEVIARLLLRGLPLELVDGDASNVPITWVEAILLKLQELLPEKKLFVVTVLGIQSSGKSTLLNTMFGLQFAVSAGRCTKGVFMQVIAVHRTDLPMDFIAVLDTEGLRAPELKHVNYNHDNELATLAIGLGDITLINIMGQNTSDIKDILQIAVHAFLRMKRVNINTHQTCIFIHQSVTAVQAKGETVQSCIALQDQLDSMTKEAAHEEGLKDIQTFSQIIKFNALENVCYFSTLWHGDPPTAHSNPGYSDNVRSVLESLLTGAANKQTTFLSVSDFGARLRDLWSAILDDDFVFSFRNSLEVRAYNDMSKFYSTIDWELTFSIMNWLQTTAYNNIKTCETAGDLDTCIQRLLRELLDTTAKETKVLEQKLVQYFDKNSLKGIMIQWKNTKLNSLTNSTEEKITEGRKYLHEVEKAHKFDILSRSKWSRLENDLMEKAVKLATELDGNLDGDSEFENRFGKTWDDWKSNLPTEDQNKFDMETLIQTVLFESFQAHGQIVQEELKCPTFHKHDDSLSLRISVSKEDLKDTDLSFNTSLNCPPDDTKEEDLQKATLLTHEVLHDIDVHLKKLTANGKTKFQRAHADHAIKLLKDHFEKWNDGEGRQRFTVLPSYVIRVAVFVGRYCGLIFDKMQEDYESRHGVAAKLKNVKTFAYNFFKNTLKHCAEEVTAADLLCNKVKPIVESTVAEGIPRIIADELFRFFAATKHHLILNMMDDLATMGEFKEFQSYITNPTAFAYEWITKHTNKQMFCRSKDNISRYEELVKAKVESIVKSIERAAKHGTKHVLSISGDKGHAWVSAFCDRAQESIPVIASSLEHLETRQIEDFDNFVQIFMEKIEAAKTELLNSFGRHTGNQTWAGTPPYQLLFDKLWGCEEHCPFCGEPCDDTTPDHPERSHHCIQHRPTGVRGYRWKKDDQFEGLSCQKNCLITQTCNYWVQCAGMEFSCKGCSQCENPTGEYHLYIEYKKYFPRWDIAPDPTNSVSKYWMWFMATYREDLAKMYSTLPPDVPEEWFKITREEALGDLRKYRK